MLFRSRSLLPVASALVGLSAFAAQPAHANLIQNSSFEMLNGPVPSAVTLTPGSTFIQNWDVVGVTGSQVAVINNNNGGFGRPGTYTTPFGDYFVDLSGSQDHQPYGGVQQTFNTVAGATYNVSFYVGNSNSYPDPGAGVIAQIDGQAVSASPFYTPIPAANLVFQQFSFNFVADDASTTLSFFGNNNGPDGAFTIALDNVEVNAVPEPAFYAMSSLLGLGGGGLLLRRRRARA